MTEYEVASLALQEAALAAQWAAVWVAALVGAAQCALIGYGLYFMRRAALHRDNLHRETMAAHEETMAALKAEREEQSERHREAMAAHEETMAALQSQSNALEGQREEQSAQREALRELIRRTAAPPAREP